MRRPPQPQQPSWQGLPASGHSVPLLGSAPQPAHSAHLVNVLGHAKRGAHHVLDLLVVVLRQSNQARKTGMQQLRLRASRARRSLAWAGGRGSAGVPQPLRPSATRHRSSCQPGRMVRPCCPCARSLHTLCSPAGRSCRRAASRCSRSSGCCPADRQGQSGASFAGHEHCSPGVGSMACQGTPAASAAGAGVAAAAAGPAAAGPAAAAAAAAAVAGAARGGFPSGACLHERLHLLARRLHGLHRVHRVLQQQEGVGQQQHACSKVHQMAAPPSFARSHNPLMRTSATCNLASAPAQPRVPACWSWQTRSAPH